jgi:hypothetical protein
LHNRGPVIVSYDPQFPLDAFHSRRPLSVVGSKAYPLPRAERRFGHSHGYDVEIFYLGLALDERYVEGWVEGCLERIGEDHPEEALLFRDLFEDETQTNVVVECLKADCEVRAGRPAGL